MGVEIRSGNRGMLGCVFGMSDSYDCKGDYGSNFDF